MNLPEKWKKKQKWISNAADDTNSIYSEGRKSVCIVIDCFSISNKNIHWKIKIYWVETLKTIKSSLSTYIYFFLCIQKSFGGFVQKVPRLEFLRKNVYCHP